ncbi:MAG: tyrosine-type recombinase/integrase [Verrucomicrobiota bacterium]
MFIERRVTKKGTVTWRLDYGIINGKHVRVTFATKAEAEGAMALAKRETIKHGRVSQELSPALRAKIVGWLAKLPPSVDIDDVFKFYLLHHSSPTPQKPLQELLREYSDHQESLNLTRKYITTSQTFLDRFFHLNSGIPLNQITRENIAPFVLSAKSVSSKRNRLGAIRAFYEWLIMKRYVHENPCLGTRNRIPIADQEEKEILSLGLEECRQLLAVAQHEENADLLGYLTLALFCGLRPAEIERTPTSCLDLDEGVLRVLAKHTKTAKSRVVPLSPAALAHLRVWASTHPDQTRFQSANFQKRWAALRDEAKLLKGWVPDILRHTFASMHYSHHQNTAQLKALLGHVDSEDTLFRHYRACVTVSGKIISPKIAAAFWALEPGL